MSQSTFTFPPPPPPPPPKGEASPTSSYNNPNNFGRYRNSKGNSVTRDFDRGNSLVGRRGGEPVRSSFRGHHARGTHENFLRARESAFIGTSLEKRNTEVGRYRTPDAPNRGGPLLTSVGGDYGEQSIVNNFPQALRASPKRDHMTAFNKPSRGDSRSQAAPSVPSFLSSVPGLFPASTQSSATSASGKTSKTRKRNQLGLTPAFQDTESSSDDADEEARIAATTNQSILQFEYRGQKSTLTSPADIAAWVAERREKFPTLAKAEKAKREADEKGQIWEQEKKIRQEDAQRRREERERNQRDNREVQRKVEGAWKSRRSAESEEKPGDQTGAVDLAEMARHKTHRLLRKAAKAKRRLAEAEKTLQRALSKANVSKQSYVANDGDNVEMATVVQGCALPVATENTAPSHINGSDNPSISSGLSDSEATSSSGSSSSSSNFDSSSDSDGPPQSHTTKRTAPDRVPAPSRDGPKLNLCRTLLKTGRCKFGERCRFSHMLPEGKDRSRDSSKSIGGSRRKTLYQVMVEQEQKEERRLVLENIISMGEAGLLFGDDKDASSRRGGSSDKGQSL